MVEHYTDDQRRRLAVKPGMTGPMQVNGRGDLPFEARLALELDYIETVFVAPRCRHPAANDSGSDPRKWRVLNRAKDSAVRVDKKGAQR